MVADREAWQRGATAFVRPRRHCKVEIRQGPRPAPKSPQSVAVASFSLLSPFWFLYSHFAPLRRSLASAFLKAAHHAGSLCRRGKHRFACKGCGSVACAFSAASMLAIVSNAFSQRSALLRHRQLLLSKPPQPRQLPPRSRAMVRPGASVVRSRSYRLAVRSCLRAHDVRRAQLYQGNLHELCL